MAGSSMQYGMPYSPACNMACHTVQHAYGMQLANLYLVITA